ncbi:MAG: DUF6033 family protein [Clostridium sp.]|nr:DUF6033 family protein [Clostridium sp.]
MSVEIANHYGGYATGTYDSVVKKNTAIQSDNAANSVEEYYKRLCKKFSQISFNTNGGVMPCSSNKVVVNLSYDCLKKMATDPEFAKKIEWNLSGEVAANSQVYSFAKRDGVELGGRTVTYDANGNRKSSCGGMRTANTSNKSSGVSNTQKQQKAAESRRNKKRERKEYLEKAHEKRKRNEEYLEELLSTLDAKI